MKDTPPTFGKLGYVFDIAENNEIDVTVGVVGITISENLKDHIVSTEVMNDDSKSFSIDANGNLKVIYLFPIKPFLTIGFLVFSRDIKWEHLAGIGK